jgi:hypothetical protein
MSSHGFPGGPCFAEKSGGASLLFVRSVRSSGRNGLGAVASDDVPVVPVLVEPDAFLRLEISRGKTKVWMQAPLLRDVWPNVVAPSDRMAISDASQVTAWLCFSVSTNPVIADSVPCTNEVNDSLSAGEAGG